MTITIKVAEIVDAVVPAAENVQAADLCPHPLQRPVLSSAGLLSSLMK